MRVNITFEIDDESREAIAAHFGKSGKASYDTVKTWIVSTVCGELEAASVNNAVDEESEK